MSTIYNLEPPTKGKVVITTSMGDVDIELWPKEAPKAVRNFVQLCLEGYYDGHIFHRIIKDFMVQTGDPTGTGEGGDSIYDGPFDDELHQRIKFNHRGQVACANPGQKNCNGSQFFITLDKTEWLDRKHTIFGKVTGDTIFNVVNIGELETDDGDRPHDPPIIKSVEVIWNPFDDIVPRNQKTAAQEEADRPKKKKKKEKKKLNLLSFGAEAEEEEEVLNEVGGGVKSAHDVVGDSRLAKAGTVEEEEARKVDEVEDRERQERAAAVKAKMAAMRKAGGGDGGGGEAGGADDPEEEGIDFDERMRRQILARRNAMGDNPLTAAEQEVRAAERAAAKKEADDARAAKEEERERREEERRNRKSKLELKRGAVGRGGEEAVQDSDLMTPLEAMRAKYKQKKRKTEGREKDTLARLNLFKKRGAPSKAGEGGGGGGGAGSDGGGSDAGDGEKKDIVVDETLPAAWRVDDYLDGGSEDDEDWRGHTLQFKKNPFQRDEGGRTVDDYVVEDPLLEKAKGKKWSKQAMKEKKREREWNGGALT